MAILATSSSLFPWNKLPTDATLAAIHMSFKHGQSAISQAVTQIAMGQASVLAFYADLAHRRLIFGTAPQEQQHSDDLSIVAITSIVLLIVIYDADECFLVQP
jgi:hypothetical protein|eukprot:CAMPEP_0169099902 /NCGR_PEP_ID=MMETSP1015-20121227/20801_1 /TAXON_ID=342587 /ORGANISM="Karlodinium micrum, Strain CCMP2283" /LENGTH=102 /DNA_ID=CAMNT_0009160807 /DNA_START=431 /DNA_END=739 /DNA_ORIENTATION=-